MPVTRSITRPSTRPVVRRVTRPYYPPAEYEWLKTAGNDFIRDPENEIIIIKVE